MITQPQTVNDPAPFPGAVISEGRWVSTVADAAAWLQKELRQPVTYSMLRVAIEAGNIRLAWRNIDAADALEYMSTKRRRRTNRIQRGGFEQ